MYINRFLKYYYHIHFLLQQNSVNINTLCFVGADSSHVTDLRGRSREYTVASSSPHLLLPSPTYTPPTSLPSIDSPIYFHHAAKTLPRHAHHADHADHPLLRPQDPHQQLLRHRHRPACLATICRDDAAAHSSSRCLHGFPGPDRCDSIRVLCFGWKLRTLPCLSTLPFSLYPHPFVSTTS